MEETKKIIESAFRSITEKGYFDIEKGNAPIPGVLNESMSIIPKKMTDYVNECGYGCCFVFSAYMIDILEKHGINSYMIGTIEDTGIRASVLYEDKGNLFVANPVEDIEYFTNNNILPNERKKYYLGDTSKMVINGIEHDDANYSLEEFAKKYGQIWLIGKMSRDSSQTLLEAMTTKEERCLMPLEVANFNCEELLESDIKKVTKK